MTTPTRLSDQLREAAPLACDDQCPGAACKGCLTELLERAADRLDTLERERDEARVLSAPNAASLLLGLKKECECQNARADAAEAEVRRLTAALAQAQETS